MDKKLLLELIWWIFTALVILLVLFPIYSTVTAYPFYLINIIYILVFITLTRYIFLLRFTFLAKPQRLKVILFFLCIPLVFYLVQELNYFQTFLDEEGPRAVVGPMDLSQGGSMVQYIRTEMLLFGVGSIISGVVFPFRLLVSIWRLRNRNAV